MATIEPRLIHLLNDPLTNLPPIHLPNDSGASGPSVPLPAIRPNTTATPAQLLPPQLPSFYTGTLGAPSSLSLGPQQNGVDDFYTVEGPNWPAGGVNLPSLTLYQSLLDHTSNDASAGPSLPPFNSLRDQPAAENNAVPEKHKQPAGTATDDFPQLPQPINKKQKPSAQPAGEAVPHIFGGLFEPLPGPLQFAPMASDSLINPNATTNVLPSLKDLNVPQADWTDLPAPSQLVSADTGDTEGQSPVSQSKVCRSWRKWTEEETIQLFKGVSRHGIGKWKAILEDPDFTFDSNRSAVSLKDRFRICRPPDPEGPDQSPEASDATEGADQAGDVYTVIEASQHLNHTPAKPMESAGPAGQAEQAEIKPVANATPLPVKKRRKRGVQRKNLEDLVKIGITEPFKASSRKPAIPFTDEEDISILQGILAHGSEWSKIIADTRWKHLLTARRPRDLRDRTRNHFKRVYDNLDRANPSGARRKRRPEKHVADAQAGAPAAGFSSEKPGLDAKALPHSPSSTSSSPSTTAPSLPPGLLLSHPTVSEVLRRLILKQLRRMKVSPQGRLERQQEHQPKQRQGQQSGSVGVAATGFGGAENVHGDEMDVMDISRLVHE